MGHAGELALPMRNVLTTALYNGKWQGECGCQALTALTGRNDSALHPDGMEGRLSHYGNEAAHS